MAHVEGDDAGILFLVLGGRVRIGPTVETSTNSTPIKII